MDFNDAMSPGTKEYICNAKRFSECFHCEYFNRCLEEVKDPEDYSDGSCKTKERFMS